MTLIEKKGYYKTLLVSLIVMLFLLIVFTSTLGVANISFLDCMKIILNRIPFIGDLFDVANIKKSSQIILLNIRLPRILLSGLVGMGLSVVGSTYQGLFRNPMADPYVLGVSSGAAMGATIAIILGINVSILGFGGTTIMAFIGAIVTTVIVYNISRIGSKISIIHLLLSGITVSFFLSSIISLLMIFNREGIERIILWTMGSFSAAGWKQVAILFPIIMVGIVLILPFSRDLNIILLGDESAKSMGVEADKIKKILMIISSLIVAAIVSVSGIIGFVGLIIPHSVRLIFGTDNRVLIPFSAVVGGIFMIICDTLARTLVPPIEIPVGAITALFGAPYFIYLLNRSKKKVI